MADECLSWVNFGLHEQPRHRSAYPREADANDANADRPVGMSAVRGKADVACQGLSGPFLANSGYLIFQRSVRSTDANDWCAEFEALRRFT